MQLAPWIQPPNYLQAIEAGASLGARLRQQRAAEEENQQRLRLSFAENALRQQAHQDAVAQHAAEMNFKNNELLMRRGNNEENLLLKGQLEEGRNLRAADALAAQNQRKADDLTLRRDLGLAGNEIKREVEGGKNERADQTAAVRMALGLANNEVQREAEQGRNIRNQDTLALRQELGLAGNEIKRESETGKNNRALAYRELRREISDNANDLKREFEDNRNTRFYDSLDFQKQKFDAEFDLKLKKVSDGLNPYDKKILDESLKSVRAEYKDDPFTGAARAAQLLRTFDPRNKPTAAPAQQQPTKAPFGTEPPSGGNFTLPMPNSKADLETGKTYRTSRGPARWDGDSFVQ